MESLDQRHQNTVGFWSPQSSSAGYEGYYLQQARWEESHSQLEYRPDVELDLPEEPHSLDQEVEYYPLRAHYLFVVLHRVVGELEEVLESFPPSDAFAAGGCLPKLAGFGSKLPSFGVPMEEILVGALDSPHDMEVDLLPISELSVLGNLAHVEVGEPEEVEENEVILLELVAEEVEEKALIHLELLPLDPPAIRLPLDPDEAVDVQS